MIDNIVLAPHHRSAEEAVEEAMRTGRRRVSYIIGPRQARRLAEMGMIELPDNFMVTDKMSGFHRSGLSIEKWWFDEDLSRIERRQINPRTMWRESRSDQVPIKCRQTGLRTMLEQWAPHGVASAMCEPLYPCILKPCTRAVRNAWSKS